jgi:hypothetical protein
MLARAQQINQINIYIIASPHANFSEIKVKSTSKHNVFLRNYAQLFSFLGTARLVKPSLFSNHTDMACAPGVFGAGRASMDFVRPQDAVRLKNNAPV